MSVCGVMLMVCEGRLGRSAAHCLTCSLFPVLQRSHANMFVIRTVASIGEITAVRLWHYNLGPNPKWFVLLLLVFRSYVVCLPLGGHLALCLTLTHLGLSEKHEMFKFIVQIHFSIRRSQNEPQLMNGKPYDL